jgi:hypothetical protein
VTEAERHVGLARTTTVAALAALAAFAIRTARGTGRLGLVAVQVPMTAGHRRDVLVRAERVRIQQDDAVAPVVAETAGKQRDVAAAIGGHDEQLVVAITDDAAHLVDHQADRHVLVVQHDNAPFVRRGGMAGCGRVVTLESHETAEVDHRNRRAAQVQHADADGIGERRRMHRRHADDLLNRGHR